MSSKRKHSALGLERRVRARREDDWEPSPELREASQDGSSAGNDVDNDDDSGSNASDGDERVSGSEHDDSDEPDDDDSPRIDLASVSFGALARAQASMAPSSRRSKKAASSAPAAAPDEAQEAPRRSTAPRQPPPKRSSKHAPQEQTSKKPVSRRREIVADPRRKPRDPRFDAAVGGRVDEAKASKAYAFLDDYRASEMAELRALIKKTKEADAKERLKRQLMAMESRQRAARKRLDEEALLRDHRRQEKELVAQGKKPFYLKKSEQRDRLLTKRYEGMSKGQVDKAIARKRKKVAGKEKKELDSLQRVRDRQ